MTETGTLLQNRYQIEKEIGAGGMGAVYLAVDQRFGSHVALKKTFYNDDEEFGAAFEREARLLNGLHHSVLPHVSDYFTENGEHFLVMQYIEGEDLFKTLKQKKRFAVETVLHWTDDLLDALDYLHSQNPPIIHRDIKPQNLKITSRGNIILLDFGLAKLKSEDSTTRSVFGYSRRYSPLEQIQGIGTDARSDIFSLAATAYHLMTGAPPVDALDRAAAIIAGKTDPLKKANEVSAEISSETADFLDKALSLNADDRYESADAMRESLKKIRSSDLDEKSPNPNNDFTDDKTESKKSSESNHDFPALAAFAAANPVASQSEEKPEAKTDVEDFETINSEQNFSAPLTETDRAEDQTKVAAHHSKYRFPAVAAALGLLLLTGLAAAYFIKNSKSVDPANTTPTVTANAALPENSSSVQSMAVAAGGNSKAAPTEEKDEKNDSAPQVKKENVSRDKPAETTPRTPNSNGETRERVVENEPVLVDEIPSDEEIDRQIRRDERLRRRERLERRNETSDDNQRERRRRRNQRQRRNDDYFPF